MCEPKKKGRQYNVKNLKYGIIQLKTNSTLPISYNKLY